MKPTVQQQKVIDSTEKDILVEAGAGSGKTTTTVKRYMRLLRDGIMPENILAITFTDKAAGELREKVRVARRELARQGGDTNPQSFTMSTSWVGTFHSTCTRLLRALPVEAGTDPKFSVLADLNGETVRNDAFNRAMERFLQADASRVEMVALFTEKTLRDTVSFAYDELRSRGMSAPDLPLPAVPRHPTDALEYLALHAGAISEQTSTHKNHRPKAAAIAKLLSEKNHNEIRYRDLAPFVFKSKGAKVIEFSNRLPSAMKMPVLMEKWLVKRLGRKYLPDTITRRVKKPYRAPIHRSFFPDGPLDYVEALLSETEVRKAGLFEPQAVEQLKQKATPGAHLSEIEDMALVGILSTQLIDAQFVQKQAPKPPTITTSRIIDYSEIQ